MPRPPFPAIAVPAIALAWSVAFAQVGAAQGLALEFPGPATMTAERQRPLDSFRLPTGPWTPDGLPVRVAEGALDIRAWRIEVEGLTTLQIMAPLRNQLAAAGFVTLFECETRACGGFDFRYGTETLPEPDMHVDLGDFRYLSAERTDPDGPEVLALMVSRSSNAGFVQVTRVLPAGAQQPATIAAPQITAPAAAPATQPPAATGPAGPGDIGAQLIAGGAVVLEDLVFPSGAATLTDRNYPSLAELAAWLRANPDRRVTLVGHTDASGGTETNIVLSERRADSVRAALVARGVPPGQIEARGVGYLAPRASNQTEAGRTLNRRVEAILTLAP